MDSNRLTNLGIDNTGKLVLTYGQEDTDYYVDGDSTSGYIYRAAESTFFCRVRDLFPTELQAMFVDRESANAWSATSLINQWDEAQSQFPEELWLLDIQRKYLRTYQGISIDNSIVPSSGAVAERFLKTMLNGRKKYQRRMFERNQELYMATKYFGNTATQDQIMMRFNKPEGKETNYTLYLTPYSNMYIGVKFGNFTATNFRAKAGQEYTIPYSLDTADITLIYGASFIQEIGDLSKCYVGDNDFSKASRLQKLSIGSSEEGYSNTFMSTIGLGSNKLLEYLDIRNITGLNSVIDVSQCNNLTELHAGGTNATGVIFANGGKLQKAYLPDVISMTLKNLNNLEVFDVEAYKKLQTLIIENTPFVDSYSIVTNAPNLRTLRLIGLDWGADEGVTDTSILDRLIKLSGVDSSGYTTDTSVLSGLFHSPIVKEKLLAEYNAAWSGLEITYDTLVTQFTATFINDDGTVLDVQYVDKGSTPVDPLTRADDPIDTPTKESSVAEDFTFNGWDTKLTALFANVTITATYAASPRKYTIKYMSKNTVLQETVAEYGTSILYEGDTPTYTAEEAAYKYYLFTGWDKSGLVDGDKIVNAVYDSCEYASGYFDDKELAGLRPVEIYAMVALETGRTLSVSDYLTDGDEMSITLGHDYDYDDVESHEFISEKTVFDGSKHIDTGIKLFEEDRDFVIAIDFAMAEGNKTNAVLAECFQANGSNGFKLWYNGGTKLTYGTSSSDVAGIKNREMLVIRHLKGDNNLYLYTANLGGNNIASITLERAKTTTADSTFVLGCSQPEEGYYEDFALGTIHWCKLWWADLGESACLQLAAWTHEEVTLEVCGFKRYYLSANPSKRCSFSLLATHLLDRERSLHSLDSNSGGWAKTTLNTFLNTRLHNALPLEWKALIKQVQISSSVGDKSTEISTSDCYITIPAVIEVDPSMMTDPYPYEGSSISYMTTNDSRKRAFDGGDYATYWTRSPNVNYSNYYFVVQEDGSTWGYNSPQYQQYGVLIEVSI